MYRAVTLAERDRSVTSINGMLPKTELIRSTVNRGTILSFALTHFQNLLKNLGPSYCAKSGRSDSMKNAHPTAHSHTYFTL